MGGLSSQLEFLWDSWFRVRAQPPPPAHGCDYEGTYPPPVRRRDCKDAPPPPPARRRDCKEAPPHAGRDNCKDAPPPVGRDDGSDVDQALTVWCVETSRTLRLPKLAERVRVRWNSRMQTAAGRALWPGCVIELNPKLKPFGAAETWRTLKHELAHLVVYERAGRRRTDPHGPEWRAACAELGIPGERTCHTLPFERRRLKRNHVYYCPQCLAETHRVRPLGKSVACYACCRKHNRGVYDSRFRLLPKLP